MIKRTLIAIAVVALMASTVQAGLDLEEYYLGHDKTKIVKVDGSQTQTFRWPYTVSYKELTICNIPIKMHVGNYVQVEECTNKKIILVQEDCGDIGKGGKDYPCYLGCVKFKVRANFEVKMGASLHKNDSGIINEWSAYYDGDSVIPNDGSYHEVRLCVKAWKAKLYKHAAGDEVSVGSVDVTVKPN